MPERDRIASLIRLERRPDCIQVCAEIDETAPLGLRVYRGECKAAVRTIMRRSGAKLAGPGLCNFPLDDEIGAVRLVCALQHRLSVVARKPIGQKQVEQLLGISSAERLRWGKDGRLPISGSASIRRGATVVALPTYRPHDIEALAAQPSVITAWRAADEASQGLA